MTSETIVLRRGEADDESPPGDLAWMDAIDLAAPFGPVPLIVKRSFDVVLSGITLLLFAPVAALLIMAVRLSSPGPAHYRQDRIGQGGRTFRIYKFRSMRAGTRDEVLADRAEWARYVENDFKLDADDPRITSVGRILRAISLDELPQLWNVFRGDMSLIGVRPLLAEEIALRPDRDQDLYRSMRPGITGLWQVNGRSTVGDSDRHALDREYVENWSLWLDIKIAFRTPLAVLRVRQAR